MRPLLPAKWRAGLLQRCFSQHRLTPLFGPCFRRGRQPPGGEGRGNGPCFLCLLLAEHFPHTLACLAIWKAIRFTCSPCGCNFTFLYLAGSCQAICSVYTPPHPALACSAKAGGRLCTIQSQSISPTTPSVRALQGRQYAWAAEDKPLTTLTRGGCKTCGLFDDRRLPFVDVRPARAHPWEWPGLRMYTAFSGLHGMKGECLRLCAIVVGVCVCERAGKQLFAKD